MILSLFDALENLQYIDYILLCITPERLTEIANDSIDYFIKLRKPLFLNLRFGMILNKVEINFKEDVQNLKNNLKNIIDTLLKNNG